MPAQWIPLSDRGDRLEPVRLRERRRDSRPLFVQTPPVESAETELEKASQDGRYLLLPGEVGQRSTGGMDRKRGGAPIMDIVRATIACRTCLADAQTTPPHPFHQPFLSTPSSIKRLLLPSRRYFDFRHSRNCSRIDGHLDELEGRPPLFHSKSVLSGSIDGYWWRS